MSEEKASEDKQDFSHIREYYKDLTDKPDDLWITIRSHHQLHLELKAKGFSEFINQKIDAITEENRKEGYLYTTSKEQSEYIKSLFVIVSEVGYATHFIPNGYSSDQDWSVQLKEDVTDNLQDQIEKELEVYTESSTTPADVREIYLARVYIKVFKDFMNKYDKQFIELAKKTNVDEEIEVRPQTALYRQMAKMYFRGYFFRALLYPKIENN